MLYFVCFIFGILLFFDYFCNDFIVDLFTENKEIVIIIIIIIIYIQQFEKLKLSMIKRLVLSKTLLQQRIKLIDHWIPNGAKKEKRYSNVRLLNIIKIWR